MLRMKQLELTNKLQEESSRLNRVDFRLNPLEEGDRPHDWDIAVKEIGDQMVLIALAEASGEEEVPTTRQFLVNQLQHHLNQANLKPAEPWLGLISDEPYDESRLVLNIAVPIHLRQGQREGDWDGSTVSRDFLPGSAETACIVHQGKLASLPGVYSNLHVWIGENGYQFSGAIREIYHSEFGSESNTSPNLDTGLIEGQFPVQQAQIPISLQPSSKGNKYKMEPTFTTKPAFQAIGISYIGKNQKNEIPSTWEHFNRRHKEIKQNDDKCAYGLCFTTPDESIGKFKDGEFEYVAAASVDEGVDVPEGMVIRQVPAYKYAVFTHHGKLDTLGDTYKFIYETWISQAAEKVHPDKFDMEVYTEEFKLDSDDSKFYIYVALTE